MAAGESLEARVQRLEDVEAIRRLLQDYRTCLDGKDFDGYAELFTADGEFVAGPDGSIHVRGREEILAMLDGMRGNLLGERGGDDFHVAVNEKIEIDGDGATATSTWVYVIRGEGDVPDVAKIGQYRDVLRREDGRWRFRRREAPADIPAV